MQVETGSALAGLAGSGEPTPEPSADPVPAARSWSRPRRRPTTSSRSRAGEWRGGAASYGRRDAYVRLLAGRRDRHHGRDRAALLSRSRPAWWTSWMLDLLWLVPLPGLAPPVQRSTASTDARHQAHQPRGARRPAVTFHALLMAVSCFWVYTPEVTPVHPHVRRRRRPAFAVVTASAAILRLARRGPRVMLRHVLGPERVLIVGDRAGDRGCSCARCTSTRNTRSSPSA